MNKHVLLILLLAAMAASERQSEEKEIRGQCWTEVNAAAGRCNSLLATKVTREECCASSVMRSMLVAFVEHELKPGDIFYMRAFKGGVPCKPCQCKKSGPCSKKDKKRRKKKKKRRKGNNTQIQLILDSKNIIPNWDKAILAANKSRMI